MKHKLKPGIESFEVVDGKFAGRKFEKGKPYKKKAIPAEHFEKFEPIKAPRATKLEHKTASKNEKKPETN